jgi:tRNA nucleotidyltransferase/poly(A) polymerase
VWAGGCVRDLLLGVPPKDIDVATSAKPEEVRQLFGHRRTLDVGAAFGVVVVLGPRDASPIEVATFRQDAAYSDGRHPDHVVYASAREDALRRDFTINGMFYDPLRQEVIDLVDGQIDVKQRMVRAIGDAGRRFDEDKLRMLRAVRFASTLDFVLDDDTARAIAQCASRLPVVSVERIAAELRLILGNTHRARGATLLEQTGLLGVVLPELPVSEAARRQAVERLRWLGESDGFPVAFALLFCDVAPAPADSARVARQAARRLRLTNRETRAITWSLENEAAIRSADVTRWSAIQPLLIDKDVECLLATAQAVAACSGRGRSGVAFCRQKLALPRSTLDPPPLLTGDDLQARGVPRGPVYTKILRSIRAAQLDEQIRSPEEAWAMVAQMLEDV